MKAFVGLSLAAFLLSAAPSFAQDAPAAAPPKPAEENPAATPAAPARPPVLQKFENEGGKVDFLGTAHGLDGWVITNPKGGVRYVYTTPDGALLAGMLFAPDGTAETPDQVRAFRQKNPDAVAAPSKSEKLFAETEKSSWVTLGNPSASYMYVFINTNCDHCQGFLDDLDLMIRGGHIQVRLVPYGSVELNRDAAAALLSVDNPEAAWHAYVGGDKAMLGKDKIKDGAYARVDANTALVRDWKLPGPPFSLYRKPADGTITAVVGRPENKMLLAAEFLPGLDKP